MSRLQPIILQYHCCVPFHLFKWTCQPTELNEGELLDLLNRTILDKIHEKFPISQSYRKLFLKRIISNLENNGQDVPEMFFTAYTELLTPQSTRQDNSFKVYFISDDNFIPMLESTNFLSDGTTGLTTWPASLFMAEWCLKRKDVFKNKRITELGCGAGFLGLLTVRFCHPATYKFTDCNEKVLSLLRKNLEVNEVKISEECCKENADNNDEVVTIENLNWSTCEETFKDEEEVDIILAADIVFDPLILNDLSCTLSRLLTTRSMAYVSITVRNEDTYNTFIKSLHTQSLKYEEVNTKNVNNIFYYDKSVEVKILKIHL